MDSFSTSSELLVKVFKWQELIGAMIGAFTPFLLWYFAEKYSEKRRWKENLYYLQRALVDQINTILDIETLLKSFIENRIEKTLEGIQKEADNEYSDVEIFFPLFSSRPLSDDLRTISTKSGYIDNKIERAYKVSKDVPYIIEDLKSQLDKTIKMNHELVYGKLNPPKVAREMFIANIREYQRVLKKDMLETNIPTYLNILIEAWVALEELTKIKSVWRWKIRFDPKYCFFFGNKEYQEARKNNFEKMDLLFKSKAKERYTEIVTTNRALLDKHSKDDILVVANNTDADDTAELEEESPKRNQKGE